MRSAKKDEARRAVHVHTGAYKRVVNHLLLLCEHGCDDGCRGQMLCAEMDGMPRAGTIRTHTATVAGHDCLVLHS